MSRQKINVTVDIVIFTSEGNSEKILLIQRKNDPFKNQWALPSGFVDDNEDLEDEAKRELEEETGLKIKKLQQVGAFGKPGRDPRGHTVSIAYLGKTRMERIKGSDDAKDAKWISLQELKDLDLAFDHNEIIKKALAHK
ncbi:NUDIX hydrolase [Gramella sp. AN32]|uniref:NUDIX domain-containing protein n=1 Tax=Christiangramia antarctica TaxID=2058158 RepID=A0ABW5X9Y2_9FLAO|nr:NUDIX hydrolase [Gramella sp. AN32]MCM4157376.1 NUDIX hydrolase [Gramella sp. AN32]